MENHRILFEYVGILFQTFELNPTTKHKIRMLSNCSMKFGPVMLGVFSKVLWFYVLLKSRFLRRWDPTLLLNCHYHWVC